MSKLRRFRAGFLVVLSIMALILLSSSLNTLSIKPGILFQEDLIEELQELLWASKGLLDFMLILFILLPVIVAIFFFLQPARSLQTSHRRRSIISSVIQLAFLITAILLLRRRLNLQDFQLSLSNGISQNIAEFEFLGSDSALTTLPWWLNFILSFLVIGALLLIVARAIYKSQSMEDPAIRISKEAELAVRYINQGKDFNNVILECYYEMSRILKEQQGIYRGDAITPREFEERLVNLGFPKKPVICLTRLFERVRYGNQEMEEGNQNLAINCLEDIRKLWEDLR